MDKAVALLDVIANQPRTLAELVTLTGITRPTAHRLALALEHHNLLGRDDQGRFVLGPHLLLWNSDEADHVRTQASAIVSDLRDATGLSAQVYRRVGDARLCIAAAEPATGLRDTVPVGTLLTLKAGSAAQILVAWLPGEERDLLLQGAAYSAEELATVRRRGWAHSLGQREHGVGSISVPARNRLGSTIAAVSISGPQERLLSPSPQQRALLVSAASRLVSPDEKTT